MKDDQPISTFQINTLSDQVIREFCEQVNLQEAELPDLISDDYVKLVHLTSLFKMNLKNGVEILTNTESQRGNFLNRYSESLSHILSAFLGCGANVDLNNESEGGTLLGIVHSHFKLLILIIAKSAEHEQFIRLSKLAAELLHSFGLLKSNLIFENNFSKSFLRGIRLISANIPCADFSHLDLSNADLSNSDLQYANLSHATLDNTTLSNVKWGQYRTLHAHGDSHPRFNKAIFSLDGNKLIAEHFRKSIYVWDLNNNNVVSTLGGYGMGYQGFGYCPQNELALSMDGCTISLYCIIKKGSLSHTNIKVGGYLALSPVGDYFTVGTEKGNLQLWDFRKFKLLKQKNNHESRIVTTAFSPNGEYILSACAHYRICCWWHASNYTKTFIGHSGSINSVTMTTNNQYIASASDDKTVRLWDSHSEKCLFILHGHKNDVTSVAFSPRDDLIASCSKDQTIRLWSVATGICLTIIETNQRDLKCITFSPTSPILAAIGCGIKLWDLAHLPRYAANEPLHINSLKAKEATFLQVSGLTLFSANYIRKAGAGVKPSRMPINDRHLIFFGDKNAPIAMTILGKIFYFMDYKQMHFVIPAVCRLWREAALAYEEHSPTDRYTTRELDYLLSRTFF